MDDFSQWVDPAFSKIRAKDLSPEAVVSREARDLLAGLDEALPDTADKQLLLVWAMGAAAFSAIFKLEGQIIELRKELGGAR